MADPSPGAGAPTDLAMLWADLSGLITRQVIVVGMGVSGSGKTTVGALLASAMHWPFQEGDDLHPPANIAKMHSGTPLNDEDRLPWLHAIAAVIDEWRASGRSGVVACSALKRAYRDIIIGNRPEVVLVYLKGSKDLIGRRLAARHEHFMPAALLDSQFETLEEPSADEHPIEISVSNSPTEAVVQIVQALARRLESDRAAADAGGKPARSA